MPEKLLDISALRFLVVDDNPNMRSIVKNILKALGAVHIKEAEDGTSALTALKTFSADIIITNWMMAPLDGLDFTRMIRRLPDSLNAYLPIIMLTGHTEVKRVAEAREAGITEFLAKPISTKSLYLRIAEVILYPRRFIRTKAYFGPDRHRHGNENYTGPLHREKDRKALEARGLDEAQVEKLLKGNRHPKDPTIIEGKER